MILIFSITNTSRLRYIANLILTELHGIPVRITTSRNEFMDYPGAKINYSQMNLQTGLWICSKNLLFETDIRAQEIDVSDTGSLPVLFKNEGDEPDFYFDVFAASFYLVSRYEEYLSPAKDKHNRFPAQDSLALKYGFLHRPVVNEWASLLLTALVSLYPHLEPKQPGFNFISTIDVDHLFAHKGRTLSRLIGGWVQSLSAGMFGKAFERLLVLMGFMRDPFDTFGYLREIHKRFHLTPLFFILCADYGGNDNNIPPEHPLFKQKVDEIKFFGSIGIHPSIKSNNNFRRLEQEISSLEFLSGQAIDCSRQHFLIIDLPETYRRLVQAGIRDDYSMGYATLNGFRAGIASSFLFFDLDKNEELPIRVHPVAFMDVTLKNYLRLTPEESKTELTRLLRSIHSVGGECVGLWHNESLSEKGEWKGWRNVFEGILEQAEKLKP